MDEMQTQEVQEVVKNSFGHEVFEWVKAILFAVIIALLIRTFLFTVVRVDGSSMVPTLENNQRLIVWRLGYTPTAGDVVIFCPPIAENEAKTFFKTYWVKRVIATEGQHVVINYEENQVYVDDEPIKEPYLNEVMQQQFSATDIVVPEGQIFLMGDNRNHSRDGRMIGCVDESAVIGRAVLRFWPLNEMGVIQHYER